MVILPQVWATAASASANDAANGGRKGPHRLVLLQGQGEPVRARRPELSLAPKSAAKVAPELAFYRKYTEALLRRYMKLSMDAGRVPSLLGRELFRGNVSHCRVTSFEDVVIFVHDVERCLEKLSPGQQHLLRRIALQEYTQGETSAMLGISLRTVVRRYSDTLDVLTRMLLDKGMLQPLAGGGVDEAEVSGSTSRECSIDVQKDEQKEEHRGHGGCTEVPRGEESLACGKPCQAPQLASRVSSGSLQMV